MDAATASRRILVVEDDPTLSEVVEKYLRREGYEVAVESHGDAGLSRALEWEPDLVVLDLMLPGMDGLEVCQRLHRSTPIPVVMLTARAAEDDRVLGLELGADDYVTKPFDERELLARVHSVLRRAGDGSRRTGGSRACFAGWTLDLDAYELTSPVGEPVRLTSHEFQLLAAFVQHPGRVLTREAILDLVAGRDWSPDDRSVDVLVGRLRRKIENDPRNPRLIETVRGVGYKLVARVEAR